MAKTRIKKTGSQSDKLIKELRNLDAQTVSFGHYESQGLHYSKLTYPALLSVWAVGGPQAITGVGTGVVRNPRAAANVRMREWLRDAELRKAFMRWMGTKPSATTTRKLLNDFGAFLRDNYKEIFGRVGPFMPPDSTGTPMFEIGDLKNKTAYKTSLDRKPKTS